MESDAATEHDGMRHHLRAVLGFQRIGGVYVLLAIIVVFSFWSPETFPNWATVQQIANSNSVAALAALALIVPLCAGLFDISTAYTMSLSGVTTAFLLTNGSPLAVALLVAVLASLLVGIINATLVVIVGIESFIGTLAVGSLILASITYISGDSTIVSSDTAQGAFPRIAQTSIGGFTLPVFYVIVASLFLWLVVERSATGRRLYAIGFNREAARLAGIATTKIRFFSLITSSLIAGFAGIVLASQLGSGSPSAGSSYLLPAFAAVFLGATQFKPGRYNVWGTILAVVLLGVGTIGLGLAHAPIWAGAAFTGIVLIGALTVTSIERRRIRVGATHAAANEARDDDVME